MRYLLFAIAMVFSFGPCQADETHDSVTWKNFVGKHPKCMRTNAVYEGCDLLLCSDGEYLFAQFNILHPAMQMRILMQGLTLYIDPTGRKKEKYAIVFPSADDVCEQMNAESLNPSNRQQGEERPDITPLITCMQKHGAIYDVKGNISTIARQMFSIMLNEEKNMLSYSVLIPIADMMKEKKVAQTWSVGIYSEGGRKTDEVPDMQNRSMRMRPELSQMQKESESHNNQEEMRKIMSKDIESWIKFSLEKICSLND